MKYILQILLTGSLLTCTSLAANTLISSRLSKEESIPPVFYSDTITYNSNENILPYYLKKNNKYQIEKDRIYNLIQNQGHYLLSTLKSWNNDPLMKLTTKSASGEHMVRPNATMVADLAFLYRFGHFNPEIVGYTRKEMLNNAIIPMLRYLIRTHLTGDLKTDDGKSWGDSWQSAHWASPLGNAAWWTWDKLPIDIQEGIKRVVSYEADRIERSQPPHQLKYDSKSEENAWNSQILSTAIILMPYHTHKTAWEKALQKWSFSSYLRPADAYSKKIVDGTPVSQQFNGANIYNDFTLENHNFIHPDYMGAWFLNAGNDLDYLMTNRKPFESFLYNLPGIYNNQKKLLLPDGGYCYPNGQDWALFRNVDWIPTHATALVRFHDPGALYFLQAAIKTAEKMQARNPSGAIYAPGENFFPSAQGHLGYWLIQAWLILHYAEEELTPIPPAYGVTHFVDGQFIINRTKKAFHSISWGEKIMLQLMSTVTNDHIMSPYTHNGIGGITVQNTIQPVTLKSMEIISKSPLSFKVQLVINHGKYAEATILCESTDGGKLIITESLKALQNFTSDTIHTLEFGILNNPNWVYETGNRRLQIGEKLFTASSGTGKIFTATGKNISVDKLSFKLNNNYPILYKIADKIDNSRFTDIIILNYIQGVHQWKSGEIISLRKVAINID
ncbi:hypothetical protein [Elizabethkingia anophelis]|uniref:hypothetical protein n=1 Tax=Elizabethkingia anophelis TaxID=1117645 RepID=UPI00389210D2